MNCIINDLSWNIIKQVSFITVCNESTRIAVTNWTELFEQKTLTAFAKNRYRQRRRAVNH